MKPVSTKLLILFIILGVLVFSNANSLFAKSKNVVITAIGSDEKAGHAWLGVMVEDLDKAKRDELKTETRLGAVVRDVLGDSPADKAGIQEDDVITKVDDTKIRRSRDLIQDLKKKKPGDKVVVEFFRENEKKTLGIVLGERDEKSNIAKVYGWNPGIYFPGAYFGVEVQEMDDNLAEYFGADAEDGLLVTEVYKDSPAEEAGINSGDIILQIGDEKVADKQDLSDIINDYDEGDSVDVLLLRKGQKQTVAVELADNSFHKFDIRIPHIPSVAPMELHIQPEIHKELSRELSEEMQDVKKLMKDWKNVFDKEMKEQIKYEVEQSLIEQVRQIEQLEKELDELRQEIEQLKN